MTNFEYARDIGGVDWQNKNMTFLFFLALPDIFPTFFFTHTASLDILFDYASLHFLFL